MIGTRFGSTLKLVKNMKLIDTKLGSLTALEEKYTDATKMFRGTQQVAEDTMETLDGTITQTPLETQGTLDNPFSLGGENATEEETDAAFEALPEGAWFINPADGQPLQKVG